MCCSHRQAALPWSASWEHKSTYGVYGQQVISRHLGTTQLSYPTLCHGKHNLGMPWAALPFMKQWSRQSQQHISTWWAHKAGAAQVTCSVLSPHQHHGDTALSALFSDSATLPTFAHQVLCTALIKNKSQKFLISPYLCTSWTHAGTTEKTAVNTGKKLHVSCAVLCKKQEMRIPWGRHLLIAYILGLSMTKLSNGRYPNTELHGKWIFPTLSFNFILPPDVFFLHTGSSSEKALWEGCATPAKQVGETRRAERKHSPGRLPCL